MRERESGRLRFLLFIDMSRDYKGWVIFYYERVFREPEPDRRIGGPPEQQGTVKEPLRLLGLPLRAKEEH